MYCLFCKRNFFRFLPLKYQLFDWICNICYFLKFDYFYKNQDIFFDFSKTEVVKSLLAKYDHFEEFVLYPLLSNMFHLNE